MDSKKWLVISVVLLSLFGCGGSSDSDGTTEPPANKTPTSNAGVEQTADEKTVVTLAGTSSELSVFLSLTIGISF